MAISSTVNSQRNLTRGYLMALIGTLFLSTTAILIRYLTQTYQLPALALAFWRDFFVSLTLLITLTMFNRRLLRVAREQMRYLVLYGLMVALFNAFWTLSVALNGAAVATVLVYSSAGFTALLGWWLLKEHLGWVKVLAVACSLGGCALVSGATQAGSWSANLMGIFTGILAGLLYAIYSIMGRSAAQRGLNPWSTLLYIFAFAAGFLLVINLLPIGLPGKAVQLGDLFWLGQAWAGWGVLFLLAAIPTIGGFGFYMVSLGYLPSSVANLIATLEPTFTAVTAYFFLGERMNLMQIGGSVMILAGVIFIRVYEGWLERQADSIIQPAP
jgi:drug/metabolite transporter (DMT)-like permease